MNTSSINENRNENLTCSFMTLSGQGQVTANPDTVVIRLGVQTTGDDLADIQAENARISQDILQSLMQMGVSDIKTFQYVIEKNYRYEDGNRIDNGYTVRNIFEIKTDDISQTGAIIDTAVSNGANVVEFVSFEVSNADFYYQQALNLAVEDAIQKSKSIASFLGLRMYPVPIKIVENSSIQPFPSQMRTLREGVTTTPIEPGQYLINASVTVDFYYN